MDFEIITKAEDFWSLKEDWNQLNRYSEYPNLFLTHEWVWTWWQAFARPEDLWILAARDDGCLTGIIPFMKKRIRRHGLPLETIQFLANAHSNETGFISPEMNARFFNHLIDFLSKNRSAWDIMNLSLLSDKGPLTQFLASSGGRNTFYWGIKPGVVSPVLHPGATFETYLQSLSKKSRYNVRKKRRAIEKLPGFKIRHFCGTAGAGDFLKAVHKIEKKSWKYSAGNSLISRPNVWTFYKSIVAVAAQKKWFQGFVLYLNDKPAAFELAFAFEEELFSQKISYAAEWAKYSPGFVLKTDVVRWACENGFKTNHLLGNEEPWKFHLGGSVNPHVYVLAYKPGIHRKLLAKWEFEWIHQLGRLKRIIKKRITSRQKAGGQR
ncbi:hypothetical protein BMS3Abin05_02011 [bacterium BMS3Abin05]|nr:hypothetical protein BMS3Abin05_02011 [bacterium BMS3Abin05]GBE27666.1 hypothetical protein BMS3Bbin03_01595 [bacterium BMS3Bbin03]